MRKNLLVTPIAIAVVSIVATAAAAPPNLDRAFAENSIKLTGCLVRGEGDGAGYLLTNAPAEPGWVNPSEARTAPNAVGTTGGFTSVFYWLNSGRDLKSHVGQRVEIEGDLAGNLKDGEIKVDRQAKWTEVTVKADGRTMKYAVPHMSVVPNPDHDKTQRSDVLVRRVNVEKVRMIAPSCAP
jgi:hypothetical protein